MSEAGFAKRPAGSTSTPARCRSCGAPIRWVRTERGRPMPLDADPYRAGPEQRLMDAIRTMLVEHRAELAELYILESLEQAVTAYDRSFDPRGLFVLRNPTDGTTSPVAIATTPDAFGDEPVYRSHFATCPQAGSWRR